MTKKHPGAKLGQSSKRTLSRAKAFCEVFTDTANVGRACAAIGVGRTFIYEWKRDDPVFARMFLDAEKAGTTLLEDEAHRRAVDGVERPIYQGGALVGHERMYSDTLMSLLLRARSPARYRENISLEHGGGIAVGQMTEEQVNARIAELLAVTGIARPPGSEDPADGEA